MTPADDARFARTRAKIGTRIRELRTSRNWAQGELAARLGISQPQLSKVELGHSSLTAEQFLLVLKLFNVPASDFAERREEDSELQNAVARLGGSHLYESADVLPSETLTEAQQVVREALVSGGPRLITALAPVLVRHANRLSLPKIQDDLARIGLERRLYWLVENTIVALEQLKSAPGPSGKVWNQIYRRIEMPLHVFLAVAQDTLGQEPRAIDVLDDTIRTTKTLHEVQKASSRISQRWAIVTSLGPEDFVRALEAARPDV